MKRLPVDVSTLRIMIQNDYVYVDKTENICQLITSGRYYFMSRPRRFGKTLLISTLKEIFLGSQELFKDLWIGKHSTYDWKKHPVIHLDFGVIGHRTVNDLIVNLAWTLDEIAQDYNISISGAPTPETKLQKLIKELSNQYGKGNVVMLIDEYDKPILDHLKDVEQAKAQRDTLKSFYDVLKGLDEHMRAIFITGVTKFAKTSLFSGLNNLNDISIKSESGTLLGYTSDEIKFYFANQISSLVQHDNRSFDEIMHDIKRWYNGYKFSENALQVYNPFSVLYCLKDLSFRNYWYESGTPSFLVPLLRAQYFGLTEVKDVEISASNLGTFDIEDIPLIPLLFQTGYITFIDYNQATKKFKLGYPNFEIEESFKKFLVSSLAYTSPIATDTILTKLINALSKQNIPLFCEILEALFSHIPSTLHIARESYYHSLFQFLMSLLALEAQSEIPTNVGIIDTVVSIAGIVYIFELKFNKPAQEALAQINDKKYYERYLLKDKKIVLVGLSFNMHERVDIECATQELELIRF